MRARLETAAHLCEVVALTLRPFHQKSSYLMQSIFGAYVVQIWSCNPRISEATTPLDFTVWIGTRYRGSLLIRNSALLGPYSRNVPRALWWSQGGGAVSYERGTSVPVAVAAGGSLAVRSLIPVQGYLAHKEQPPSLGPPYNPRYSPTVGP